MAGGSASVVLAFFVAAPPAAPVVVKPLLPMTAAFSKNFAGKEEEEMRCRRSAQGRR
jgi:hypothetical protein